MPQYNPKPVDTSGIRLDPSLLELAEYLARNTHEVWAAARVDEGWKWGPGRDDAAKLHPGLVRYEQLSESEKSYDRATAMETIKLIALRGYEIRPPENRVHPDADSTPDSTDPALLDLAQLVGRWNRLGPGRCHGGPEIYRALGERALALGEYLLAHDILMEGLRYYPGDVPLRQRQALANSRSGASMAAVKLLRGLIAEGQRDEETLALLARCYKDLWEQAGDAADGRAWLVRACDAYEGAYRDCGGYWSAINVATLAECLGQGDRSKQYATLAKAQCLRWLEGADATADRYWALATVGEASLLLREAADAERYYTEAAAVARGRYGHISTTRKNAGLINRHRGVAEAAQLEMLHRALALPRIVVFSGHRIDAPGRWPPRFPAQLEEGVREQVKSALKELNCGFGYASAANGADILFLEAVLERGGEANIVLPYDARRFCVNCVAIPGTNWEARFQKLLAHPNARVIITSQGPVDEEIAHEYANHFTLGMAGIRAWQLGADLSPLAVWNGQPGDSAGGTADAVARWRACDCKATIIETNSLLQSIRFISAGHAGRQEENLAPPPTFPRGLATPDSTSTPQASGITPRMVAMVFIDIVGYSKLAEPKIPLIIRHMLRPVALLAGEGGRTPLHMSTWGDAFYFVFDNVITAGEFALDVRDMVEETHWLALGFEEPLAIRAALHVGPVHAYINPVTAKPDFIGTNVNRAARMEPITPSGHVYASEVFAAIAFAERAEGFRCEYVGKIGLAKNYGNFPVYHVRRCGKGGEKRDGATSTLAGGSENW